MEMRNSLEITLLRRDVYKAKYCLYCMGFFYWEIVGGGKLVAVVGGCACVVVRSVFNFTFVFKQFHFFVFGF